MIKSLHNFTEGWLLCVTQAYYVALTHLKNTCTKCELSVWPTAWRQITVGRAPASRDVEINGISHHGQALVSNINCTLWKVAASWNEKMLSVTSEQVKCWGCVFYDCWLTSCNICVRVFYSTLLSWLVTGDKHAEFFPDFFWMAFCRNEWISWPECYTSCTLIHVEMFNLLIYFIPKIECLAYIFILFWIYLSGSLVNRERQLHTCSCQITFLQQRWQNPRERSLWGQ